MTARGERKREEKEEESKRKKKAGRTRGKAEKKKREILQSWYHMAGPPFLMRQRSMYSLALSHTGGTSIMPKLTCSNKPPLLLPPTQPHPCRPRPGSARLGSGSGSGSGSPTHPVPPICIPLTKRALPHFTGIPH